MEGMNRKQHKQPKDMLRGFALGVAGGSTLIAFAFSLTLVGPFVARTSLAAGKITSIDFKSAGGAGQIEISGDGPLSYEKQENAQDNQIVLEFKDAQLAKNASRKLDTTSFKGKVSLISPYQVQGQADTARVVIQLREPGSAEITEDGNKLRVRIADNGGGASGTAGTASAAGETPTLDAAAAAAAGADATAGGPVDSVPSAAAAGAEKTNLDAFTESKESKQFKGTPITLQVRDADLVDVLNLIGDASGFNMVISEEVQGKISLSLVDIPWDQALDVVLTSKKLGAERHNSILRILPLASLTAEKQAEVLAKHAAEQTEPKITRVFPISYARLGDMQAIFQRFANSTSGDNANNAGIVQADERTNSLIIRDTAPNLEKMRKLIEVLDTQTPQVLIEAKIVEANEGFARSLGGNIGIALDQRDSSGKPLSQYIASFGGNNPIDPLLGSPGIFADGSAISGTSLGSTGNALGTFGISPTLSFLPGLQRLNAILSLGEIESSLKVVSSPRTVVLNRETANIVSGTPVKIQTNQFVAGVGTVPTEVVQQANLSLNVTPTVTNEGNVVMQLTISRDSPEGQAIATRNMTTKVMVESGNTLVIGGVYTSREQNRSTGFPFLRKIPILGWLFGNEQKDSSRSELFIFITPKILNEKEAGLSG